MKSIYPQIAQIAQIRRRKPRVARKWNCRLRLKNYPVGSVMVAYATIHDFAGVEKKGADARIRERDGWSGVFRQPRRGTLLLN
jgi:hypothetical protein